MSARSKIFAAGLAAGAMVGMPSAAPAGDDYVGKTTPGVEGNSFTGPPQVQGRTATRDPGSTLPSTGGDLVGMTLIGFGAVGTGVVLMRRGRTRSVTA